MSKTPTAVTAVLLIALLSACFPSTSYFGYSLHGRSLDGDYNCTFIGVEATFKGEKFSEPFYVDVTDRGIYSDNRTHHTGEPNTGGELRITLECFDQNEQLLGTSTYAGTLDNARTPSTIYIGNYTPTDVEPGECVTPITYTGGPEFCVTMRGFTPVPPNS